MTQEQNVDIFLNEEYEKAMTVASGKDTPFVTELDKSITALLDIVVSFSESSKAVLAVLMTSIVYKIFYPKQDIRRHQSSIENGYSGRTFDTKHISPFMKMHKFPAMNESGWLTRSLEQKIPYDENYKGAITPKSLKDAFLSILKHIEQNPSSAKYMLCYMLQSLIIQRDKNNIDMAIPFNMSISDIMNVLDKHFHTKYNAKGASRLPVIALFAVYQCLMEEGFKRYENKQLLNLESHTSADSRSGRMGDIDVNDENGNPFEAVEVKFGIPISYHIVVNAVEKIHTSTVSRYYILSTSETLTEDKNNIEFEIKKLKNAHGCQLVINGFMQTLKYYFRLLENPNNFIVKYTNLLKFDNNIKFEHKQMWNEIISNI